MPEALETAANSQATWRLCPTKFNALFDAIIAYGDNEYTSRQRLMKSVVETQLATVACDCPLGPRKTLFGRTVCQQNDINPPSSTA